MTNENNIKPQNYDSDTGVAMVFDTLCDRGFDPKQVAEAIDEYDGDLWMDVFGPAVDNAADLIGLEAYPDDNKGWQKTGIWEVEEDVA